MCAHRRNWIGFLAWLAAAAPAAAGLDQDLADIDSRIAYGFYARDPAVIEAAERELERYSSTDPRIAYYRALAAWRLALSSQQRGRSPGGSLSTCIEWAERATDQEPRSAEPWILVAACSALGSQTELAKSMLHGRRFDRALTHARALDPGNPRILLVEAWRGAYGPVRAEPTARAAALPALLAAVEIFDTRPARGLAPDWGEAEALVQLGAIYLHRGEIRLARDVLDEALLLAPGYERALELRRELLAVR
jgi:tetratricopeptide (TPR) repeat protein